jgi:hypothetical protein
VHILGDGEEYKDLNGNGVWDIGEPYKDANHDGTYDAPLAPGTPALDMTGTATISNNYAGLRPYLANRLPALPTAQHNGETVSTIEAALRVKNGTVVLDGHAKVGQPDVSGGSPAMKETMDGVYVTDGFSGSAASAAVYSDNGYGTAYDLDNTPVKMPNLDDPYTDKSGVYYPTYMQYLSANALVVHGDLVLRNGTSVPQVSNGRGSISLDAMGNLQISGIVYVRGDIRVEGKSVKLRDATARENAIRYDGRGTLVAEGDVSVDAHLVPRDTFPTNDVLGVVSHGRIALGTGASQLVLAGAFFAQEEVSNAKQNQLAGTIVSNHFGMTQVPEIFQVPELAKNLPPGMPGGDDIYIYAWRRVPRSWVELE